MTVFKVVNSQLQSVFARHYPHIAIQYQIGEVVKPKIGKIFAFDTYSNARRAFYQGSQVKLYKAETSNISEPHARLEIYYVDEAAEEFWADKNFDMYMKTYDLPWGTVLCDDLKLIELML